MREPSAEDIASAKTAAKEITGSDQVELLSFPDLGAGFSLLLRRLTPAEYATYLDTGLRKEQDAREAALKRPRAADLKN